jgi:hypothetical protein
MDSSGSFSAMVLNHGITWGVLKIPTKSQALVAHGP